MTKLALAFAIAVLLVVPYAPAAEYIVRLEFMGYSDVPEAVAAPKEVVSRSIELVCQPEIPARCKAQFDRESIAVAVALHPWKDNVFKKENLFKLDLECCQSLDSGELVPDGKGGTKKRVERTQFATPTSVCVGEPVLVGGLESTRTDDKGRVTKSKRSVRLSLEKYEPQSDAD